LLYFGPCRTLTQVLEQMWRLCQLLHNLEHLDCLLVGLVRKNTCSPLQSRNFPKGVGNSESCKKQPWPLTSLSMIERFSCTHLANLTVTESCWKLANARKAIDF
jgi:hypothetical protein